MHIVRSVLLVAAALLQIAASSFPALFGVEGSIGETAEQFRTILVPKGYAFAIWLPLFIGGIYVALWHAFRPNNPVAHRVGSLAILAFLGNAAWALDQPTIGPGLVNFLILEWVLVFAVWSGAAGRAELEPTNANRVAYGFMLALGGWITVASPAGLSAALQKTGMWPLFGNETDGALLIVCIWGAIAFLLALRLAAFAYTGPILWGLFAVVVVNEGRASLTTSILIAALLIVGATVVGKWLRSPSAA
ncbi:MAG: hypothetical protein AAGH41_12530 [Pseudomonadota bacterium]